VPGWVIMETMGANNIPGTECSARLSLVFADQE
jgi:hypothetical protein